MSYDSLEKIYYKNNLAYEEIYKNRFFSENSLHFDFKIHQNDAFFFFHKDIITKLDEITRLEKSVNEYLEELPTVALDQYIKKSLIDEVQNTNKIEGIISTRKEIMEVMEDIDSKKIKKDRFKSLIKKYILLLNEEFKPLQSPQDIRDIYDELVLDEIKESGIENIPDGVIFRKDTVTVKNQVSGKIIHEGINPESEIINLISKSLVILNDESINFLIRIAIFHYVFSYIHPFYDGNGRTNRYISSLYMKKYYPEIMSFRLSLTIKENQTQYYKAFIDTNDSKNKGDISTFVYEFVDIVKKSFEITVEYLSKKKKLLDEYKTIVQQIKNLDEKEKELLYLFIQVDLFGEEAFSRKDIMNHFIISRPTLNKYLKTLTELEYLKITKKNREETYILNQNKLDKEGEKR